MFRTPLSRIQLISFFSLISVLGACDRSSDVVGLDAHDATPSLSAAANEDIVIKPVTVPGADTLRGLAKVEAELEFDIDYLKNLKKQKRYEFHAVDKEGKALTIDQVLGELEEALKHIKKRKAEKGNRIKAKRPKQPGIQCVDCVDAPPKMGAAIARLSRPKKGANISTKRGTRTRRRRKRFHRRTARTRQRRNSRQMSST